PVPAENVATGVEIRRATERERRRAAPRRELLPLWGQRSGERRRRLPQAWGSFLRYCAARWQPPELRHIATSEHVAGCPSTLQPQRSANEMADVRIGNPCRSGGQARTGQMFAARNVSAGTSSARRSHAPRSAATA